MASQSLLIRGLVLLSGALSLCCVALPRGAPGDGAPRISELAERGDPRFRASQRLVIEGLEADARGEGARARSRYERALQVDAGNPWAYLALARHYADAGEPGPALGYLDRADSLFGSEDGSEEPGSPRAEIHRIGLRGAILALTGRREEGRALLDEAARRAPGVWGDRHLAAGELR